MGGGKRGSAPHPPAPPSCPAERRALASNTLLRLCAEGAWHQQCHAPASVDSPGVLQPVRTGAQGGCSKLDWPTAHHLAKLGLI